LRNLRQNFQFFNEILQNFAKSYKILSFFCNFMFGNLRIWLEKLQKQPQIGQMRKRFSFKRSASKKTAGFNAGG